jgi:predicted enzyme related to lactoylglutathione lyase
LILRAEGCLITSQGKTALRAGHANARLCLWPYASGEIMKITVIFLLLALVSNTYAENNADSDKKSIAMNIPNKINYIEIPAKNIEATKEFFGNVFGWSFIDYGPEYSSFTDQGVDGGFFKSDLTVSTKNGSVLIVFYSNELEAVQEKVVSYGGRIVKPIFSFPGGKRFHFTDPNSNEYAVWSE